MILLRSILGKVDDCMKSFDYNIPFLVSSNIYTWYCLTWGKPWTKRSYGYQPTSPFASNSGIVARLRMCNGNGIGKTLYVSVCRRVILRIGTQVLASMF